MTRPICKKKKKKEKKYFINYEIWREKHTRAVENLYSTGEFVARNCTTLFPLPPPLLLRPNPNHPEDVAAEMRCEIFNPVPSSSSSPFRSPLATNLPLAYSRSL